VSELHTSPPAESRSGPEHPSQPKAFYGWWIVFAGTLILSVSSGIGFYGHGVFLDPLRTLHGWSKATISSAITLYFLTSGTMGMIIGRQVDRYGPKGVLIIGSVVIGAGFVLLSRIHTVWQLYAVYFMMAIGFSCTSLVPVNTLITNWFIRKRGFAMSLTNTGLSAGGIVLVPLASYMISRWGLEVALPVLGAIYCVVVIPSAIFFIRQRPSDLNQFPDGETPLASAAGGSGSPLDYAAQMQVWTRSQAVHTVALSFLSPYLGVSGAATAVSVTAAASIVGRLILGTFVDRCDKRYVIMVCFLVQGVAMLTLAHYNHVIILYLGTFAFGLTMGSIIMMQSLIIGECFGLLSFATVSGLAGLFTMTGAAFGPTIAGLIYDAAHSYRMAFTIFAAMSSVAILVIFFARPSNPR